MSEIDLSLDDPPPSRLILMVLLVGYHCMDLAGTFGKH